MAQSTTPDIVSEFQLPRLASGKVDTAAWIKHLGVQPITDLAELAMAEWPDEDSVDEFLAAAPVAC